MFIRFDLEELIIFEAEVRKALRRNFDSNPKTRGAVIDSLSLQEQGRSKYTGTVELTDPDGSKIKLELHVADHGGGRIFIKTKPPQ